MASVDALTASTVYQSFYHSYNFTFIFNDPPIRLCLLREQSPEPGRGWPTAIVQERFEWEGASLGPVGHQWAQLSLLHAPPVFYGQRD